MPSDTSTAQTCWPSCPPARSAIFGVDVGRRGIAEFFFSFVVFLLFLTLSANKKFLRTKLAYKAFV
jgi:hypothetical protein